MKNQNSQYWRYWGKTIRFGEISEELFYHLLPYHCLDVAAAGWWLLAPETPLSKRFCSQLSVSPEWLRRWFSFCLSIHDAGKFAVAFQGIVPNAPAFLVGADPRRPYTVRHDTLGYALWRRFLCPEWQKLDPPCEAACAGEWGKILRAMNSWMELATGHHGKPPSKAPVHLQHFFTEQDELAALQYVVAVSKLFLHGLDLGPLMDKALKKRLKKLSWAMAGAVVMADWIGSGIDVSRYKSEPVDLEVYWKEYALAEAKRRLEEIEGEKPTVAPFAGIGRLFPFIESPTPLQRWAADVPLSAGPQLFILEDVTGAGKTEAALVLAHRLMSRLPAEGMYVALPTMATANAMYDRLGKAYRRLFEDGARPSLVLSHGARHLSEGFRASVGLPCSPRLWG